MLVSINVQAAEEQPDQLIIINKTTNKLAFYDQGVLINTFDVGTGRKKDYTPEGTFKIVNKIKNRPYYKEKIPGGDPRNPLGDRWLGLDARETWGTTYAIHGNNNSKSIGKYVSAGCVRMHNDEIHWLFDQVKLYAPVLITYSEQTFDELALKSGYQLIDQRIEETELVLTLKQKTALFSQPNEHFKMENTLAPQHVVAIAQVDGWYLIDTWMGPQWIKEEKVIVGAVSLLQTNWTLFTFY